MMVPLRLRTATARGEEGQFTIGTLYSYFSVPWWCCEGPTAASSHGSYLDSHVKKAEYQYARLA